MQQFLFAGAAQCICDLLVKARLYDANVQAFALQTLVFVVDIAFVSTKHGFLSVSKNQGPGALK
jgi:hypothetical protein